MVQQLSFGRDNYDDDDLVIGVLNTSTRTEFRQNYTTIVTDEVYNQYIGYLNGEITSGQLYDILFEEMDVYYLDNYFLIVPLVLPKKIKKKKKKPGKKVRQEGRRRRRQRQRRMRLRDGVPLMIPYNVQLNDGVDGECVQRVIKRQGRNNMYPNDSKRQYTGETVQDLIDYCEEIKRPAVIKNILGNVIYSNDYPNINHYPSITGIVHNEHFYPIVKGKKKLELNTDLKQGEQEVDGYINFFKNNKQITDGVYDKDYKLDQVKFSKSSWNPEVLDTLKKYGIKPLSYSSGLNQGFTIDCNKCYYTTSTEGYIEKYGQFSIFDEFKDYTGCPIKDENIYIIQPDTKLCKYGITTNIMGGRTLKVFIKNKVTINIEKVLKPSYVCIWESDKLKEVYSEDHKVYNRYVGMTGRIDYVFNLEIEINNQEEREAILEEEDVQLLDNVRGPNYIGTRHTKRSYVNNYNRYLTVLDAANARTLETLFTINKPVVKIVTDSLSFKEEVSIPEGWKKEEYTKKQVSSKFIKEAIINKREKYNNISFMGAPGTGKTHEVKNNHSYDTSCAFTNKAANNTSSDNNKGVTLHSLFRLYKEEDAQLSHLQNKKIWVDEISMIPRSLWGYLMDAYMNYNVEFIFCGDFNQTPPVNESRLHYIPFMGEVTFLTKDYRNSERLIKLRDDILAGKKVEIIKTDEDYPLLNIAYYNKTCKSVNESIVKREGFKWGQKGTRVCSTHTNKKYGFMKNESFTIEYTKKDNIKLTELDNEIPLNIFNNSFEWGYCITTHKAQGDTIREDLGIHDWDSMDKYLKYTAVTRVLDTAQLKYF